MQKLLATTVLCFICQILGCRRQESSLLPLGQGALALAEQHTEQPTHAGGKQIATTGPVEVETAKPSDAAGTTGPRPEAHEPLPGAERGTAREVAVSTSKAAAGAPNRPSLEDWLGLYRGNDTTVFKAEDQPDRSFDDPKAKVRIERGARGQLQVALVDSSNDKDICKLMAVVDADVANFESGQACFLESDESMTVKSRSTKASLKDRRLTFDLIFDTTLETEIGAIKGSIDYHFDGQK